MGEKVQGIRTINRRYKRDKAIKNSIGNGESKELICVTHGHELSGAMLVGGWCGVERTKGEQEKNGTTVIA